MLDRLRRSARRFEERTGQRISPEEWNAFHQTYEQSQEASDT
jgi:hypothetical protein